MMTFIHCGDNKYNSEKFKSVKNIPNASKPEGGLWASEINDDYGWLDWCSKTKYNIHSDINNSFKFKIKNNANIVYIEKPYDPLFKLPLLPSKMPYYCIDFEECINRGIDAIYTKLYSKDYPHGSFLVAYIGEWDCNSILILNKNIIQPL